MKKSLRLARLVAALAAVFVILLLMPRLRDVVRTVQPLADFLEAAGDGNVGILQRGHALAIVPILTKAAAAVVGGSFGEGVSQFARIVSHPFLRQNPVVPLHSPVESGQRYIALLLDSLDLLTHSLRRRQF